MKTSELIKILKASIEDNGDQEVQAWEALRLCVPLLKCREPQSPVEEPAIPLVDGEARQAGSEVRARFQ